ncbi:MAG TPA: VOC family protein [Solirubrobacteraceae bacterium]|jgi:catechol 2,3-dioxygenase-like lactoylglutathione lyase family enzyme|nr:VOC family protein [Solirubrobacteraceae bacterium]
MAAITQVGRVMVPVGDQDTAISFYTNKLGFTLAADVPFGDGERWVEVAPPSGGAALALVPPRGEYQAGRMTGIALETGDAASAREELASAGVDVDDAVIGGDGTVPPMFFMRDQDGNSLLVVQQ